MCLTCYEKYGSPKIINEKIEKVVFLLEQLYEFCCVGGALHVIVSDWNLEDVHFQLCYEYIDDLEREYEDEVIMQEQKIVEKKCLDALKELTIEERASALAIHNGFIDE